MRPDHTDFLEGVRTGRVSEADACQRLLGARKENYEDASFRELLFAIDSLNRFKSVDWSDVAFVPLMNHYTADDAIRIEEICEIEEWTSDHGPGRLALDLSIKMMCQVSGHEERLSSLADELVLMLFDGTRTVSESDTYKLKEWADKKSEGRPAVMCRQSVTNLIKVQQNSCGAGCDKKFTNMTIHKVVSHVLYADDKGVSRESIDWIENMIRGAESMGDFELKLLIRLHRNDVPLCDEYAQLARVNELQEQDAIFR